ncbi:MAG: sulfatase-like hydrolase/transferase [Chloroflexi bacterium]|nr:sulfatase-like hydrolase/transferase [Chloroflexota bacterium]
MRVSKLSGYRELLYAALIIFSAVSLASLEFMKNAFPIADALLVTKTTVIYMIVLVQVLPALALLGADRLIAARYGAGRRLRVFRSVLFVVAVVLILRQLQLYWGPASDFADSVSSSGWVLVVLVDLTILAAVVGFAVWMFRGLAMFFAYMSPVAIVMTVLIPSQVPTGESLPETYGQEVVTASRSESQPAVFVLVFDELGYDVLLDDGKVDAESFPNIAALAEDGVWFTNATTNNYWSLFVLPTIIDPVKSLAERFDIRLYTQFRFVEQRYVKACGEVMTCRGYGYLTENDQLRVAGNLALRSFYQATPKPVEWAISRPMGWLLDRLGWAYPSVDSQGFHTLTKRQFDVFLDDITGRDALGRIHVLHLLLPHHPFAFSGEGNALSNGCSCAAGQDFQPEKYRQQSMYVDVLVGRLMDKLKREGIYDEAVIVLTGDHGPRPYVPGPQAPLEDSIARVPLVIRAPGLGSSVSDVDYQHIDFGPTLMDILGLPPISDAEGVSAFSEERPQRDKVFRVFSSTFIRSEEDDSWQLVLDE